MADFIRQRLVVAVVDHHVDVDGVPIEKGEGAVVIDANFFVALLSAVELFEDVLAAGRQDRRETEMTPSTSSPVDDLKRAGRGNAGAGTFDGIAAMPFHYFELLLGVLRESGFDQFGIGFVDLIVAEQPEVDSPPAEIPFVEDG